MYTNFDIGIFQNILPISITFLKDISKETSSILQFFLWPNIQQNCDCRCLNILLIVGEKTYFKQWYRITMRLNYFISIFRGRSIHIRYIAGKIMNMKLDRKYLYFLRSVNLNMLLCPSHCQLQYNEHFRQLIVLTKMWTMQFHES